MAHGLSPTPAAASPSPAAAPKKAHDRRALDAAAVALKKSRENIIAAAWWAHEKKRGSKAVCNGAPPAGIR
jgi:hypothetical protein